MLLLLFQQTQHQDPMFIATLLTIIIIEVSNNVHDAARRANN